MSDSHPAELRPAALYRLAGTDLRGFAARWLDGLKRDGAIARGLLAHVEENYDYGAHFMMANIGPAAMEDGAAPELLLTYAALAAFQEADFVGCTAWTTARGHLERALVHAHSLGDAGLAKTLLMSVVVRSTRERSEWSEKAIARSLKYDPARIAAHDQDMASIDVRDVRAAALLDPSASVDALLMGL